MLTRIINLFLSLFMFITSLFGGGGGNKNEMIKYNLSKTEVTFSVSENPSTGYQWTYNIVNENVAKVINDKYINTAPDDVVGAAGTRSLTFRGVESGTTRIVLKYERPWENNTEPARIIILYLTVDENLTLSLEVFSDTSDLY